MKLVGDTTNQGTQVTFLPDKTIFIESVYKYDVLANRLRELAYLNAGITLTLTDKREADEEGNFKEETFFSKAYQN
mgnify:CR=1 FL=1